MFCNTLKNGEELRGCIGQFTADKPLIEMVCQMAVSSCMHDPRFGGDRITKDELPNWISKYPYFRRWSRQMTRFRLRLGIDGIYITDGRRSGCFLPQVATETGWNEEDFLSYCCAHKAGLARTHGRQIPMWKFICLQQRSLGHNGMIFNNHKDGDES